MSRNIRLIERGATPAQTREIPITETEFVIGRGPDCSLRLRSEEISRHHCTIRVTGDGATLVDLGSSNGSYLNGQRVRSQAALKSLDEVGVGPFRFVVDLGDLDRATLGLSEGDSLAATMRLPRNPPPPSA